MPHLGLGLYLGGRSTMGSEPNGSPSNLVATVIDDKSIRLDWLNGATNQTGTRIYGRVKGVGSFVEYGTALGALKTKTLTGLTENTTYEFYVVHYKGSKESGASNTVNGKTFIDANANGFLPASSAAINTTSFNALDSGNTVLIKEIGTYEINNTVWLKSNTKYIFTAGSTIKKNITGGDFCHAIGNEGMLSWGRDENIEIYGNGLLIDTNGSNIGGTIINRLKAQFQLFQVDGFIVDGITVDDDSVTDQFFMCLCDCHGTQDNKSKITDIDINYYKDGLDLISCSYIDVENPKIYTKDDAIFIGIGYAGNTPYIETSHHINIISPEFGSLAGAAVAGYCVRMYAGSWAQWVSGNSYVWNESCINNGRIYSTDKTGTNVSTVAPTHTSGKVTGVDGIGWWYIKDSIETHADVTDINITNAVLKSNRYFTDLSNNVVTLGTGGQGVIDRITYDGITLPENYTGTTTNRVMVHQGYVGDVIIKNSIFTFNNTTSDGIFYSKLNGGSSFNKLTFDNCTLNLANGVLLYFTDASCRFTELVLNNCTTDLSNGLLYYKLASLNGGILTKVSILGGQLTKNDANHLFNPILNVLQNSEINVSAKFIKLSRLLAIQTTAVPINITLNMLAGTEFATSIGYVVTNTIAGNTIHIIANDVKWINPASYLFFNNQASSTVDIDISNSTGAVTAAKVRNDANVAVIECDLAYV